MSDALLALQTAATLVEQLGHRQRNLPERAVLDRAREALARCESRRAALQRRIDELEAAIERSEAESRQIDTQQARLEQQLRTVIAPREAEALQHQIALLVERRGALDDAELEALEEQSGIDDTLTSLVPEEAAHRSAIADAEQALTAAEAAVGGELAEQQERLGELRAAVDPSLLARYDRLRSHHVVAAARLVGHRCDGCHIDLSAAEVDDVRAAAKAGSVADCPQCGRMLVVA